MQQIALKKIQLGRLKDKQDYFDQIEKQRKLEVSAIEGIIEKQNMSNKDILQKALNRGNLLELKSKVDFGMDAENQSNLVDMNLNNPSS